MGLTRPRAYQIYDIDYKQSVRVITLTNITLSGGAPNQVDGVTLSLNDRVLVAGQTTGSQNGLYYVTAVGTGSNGTWQRSVDGNQTGEIESGMIVMVTEGLIWADTSWKLVTNDPIVIGTTALVFEQNTGDAFGSVNANGTSITANTASSVLNLTAGNNISITGNNDSKTVSIAVTGISLNSIGNGTSSVNVVSSGGNITASVGGTSNVVVISSAGQFVTGTQSVTGNITGGNILTAGIISAAGNISGTNATFSGNLTVNGNITYINSNVVTINDLAINLGNNAGNISQVNGGGFELGPQGSPYVTFTYNSASNALVSNVGLSAVSNVVGGNLLTSGLISAAGNVTGAYFLGNVACASGIFTTKIFNGNSEANIGASGGNANISIGGVSNVAVFTATGLNLTGAFSATGNVTGGNILTGGLISSAGNITGNYILGNGSALTGINTFATISVTGQSNVVADSIADTLTLAAGTGILITTDAGNDTVTISSIATESVFATGGSMGTIDEVVTVSEDLGSITTAVTVEYDLGTLTTAGIVSPSLLLLPTYTVAQLGNVSASPAGQFVYCSNESGGAVPAFSDGTNWRRVTDRAIVS